MVFQLYPYARAIYNWIKSGRGGQQPRLGAGRYSTAVVFAPLAAVMEDGCVRARELGANAIHVGTISTLLVLHAREFALLS